MGKAQEGARPGREAPTGRRPDSASPHDGRHRSPSPSPHRPRRVSGGSSRAGSMRSSAEGASPSLPRRSGERANLSSQSKRASQVCEGQLSQLFTLCA